MRLSFVALSVHEHSGLNIAAHDSLRNIKAVIDYAQREGCKVAYLIAFHWCKDEGGYDLATTEYFRVNESQSPPVDTQIVDITPPIRASHWSAIEGCGKRDVAQLLFTEVAKLAYAMTNGAVEPWSGEISEESENIVESKDAFTLRFQYHRN